MKKTYVYLSLLLSLIMVLAGCSDTQPVGKEPKIVRVNNHFEPGSLHPGKAQGTNDSWPMEHLLEGLYKKTPEGNKPGMAAGEPQISNDGLTWTFKLREDIFWSNGDPVTAKDFEAAWKYALNPQTASAYAYQLYYLEGAEAYNFSNETDSDKLKDLESAVGVKAMDEKTLEVKLAFPTMYFIDLTTHFALYPINVKVHDTNSNWANDASTYVSNGPYKLAEWNHKESLKLEKNDKYYDKDRVKLDEIHFSIIEDANTSYQMYRSGDLDLAYPLPQDVLAQLKEGKNTELTIASDLSTYFYRFNTTKQPFTNIKVRQALSMAIDRSLITEKVAQGGQQPAYGLVPPGVPDTAGDFQQNSGALLKEDTAEAKALLAEGLKDEGMTEMPSFSIMYPAVEGHKKIAEAIQEMWRKNLGIEVKLESLEFQVQLERESKLEFDVSSGGWMGDYADPMTFIDLFASNNQQNATGWSNAEYDKLVRSAKENDEKAARMKAMHDAEKILMSESPLMPIYFFTKPYMAKTYLKDIFVPVDRYPQLQFSDIQK